MSRPRAIALLTAALLLTGCAAPVAEQSPPSAASPAASSPASSPTPSAPAPVVTITLDGFANPAGGTGVAFDDGDEIVTFVGSLVGSAPAVSDIEDPWGNGTSMGTRYEWDDVEVSVSGGTANVWVRSATLGGAHVQTAEGITVGSTRAEALTAGAWDSYDEDGDGIADWLGIGAVEVPSTQSLTNPGETGVQFLLLGLEGDTVSEIQAPANDFTDL